MKQSTSKLPPTNLIITCSALKRAHRDILREGCGRAGYSLIHFFFFDAPESVLRQRTEARQNHFAKSNLVHSQFEVLERPRLMNMMLQSSVWCHRWMKYRVKHSRLQHSFLATKRLYKQIAVCLLLPPYIYINRQAFAF